MYNYSVIHFAVHLKLTHIINQLYSNKIKKLKKKKPYCLNVLSSTSNLRPEQSLVPRPEPGT